MKARCAPHVEIHSYARVAHTQFNKFRIEAEATAEDTVQADDDLTNSEEEEGNASDGVPFQWLAKRFCRITEQRATLGKTLDQHQSPE